MMKTLQEKVAEDVVEELKKDPSVVGIEISGSLVSGDIRPDSDIDLGVISESIETHQFVEEYRRGIKIDMSFEPLSMVLQSIETHPFLWYTTILSRIVYDPKGYLRQIHDRLEEYFENHPEIVEFWEDKRRQLKAAKMRGEEQEGFRSVLDEAEMKFSKEKRITRNFFLR
ncbi:MAG: nucleotidyltransferase domain-containing protein [Candidatus Thorarchaeota archaeon]|jgi:predicted nucleotidyltransferase